MIAYSAEQLRTQIDQKQSMIALLEQGLSQPNEGGAGPRRAQLTRQLIDAYRDEIEACKARIAEIEHTSQPPQSATTPV